MDDIAGPEAHDRRFRANLPAIKSVALLVPLVLALNVETDGVLAAEEIHLHRVVDDEVDGNEWVDSSRVATQPSDRGAHGSEVNSGGDADEVLHDDAGRVKRKLLVETSVRVWRPAREVEDVLLADDPGAAIAEHALEQDFDCHR